jgi:hypothetical protein
LKSQAGAMKSRIFFAEQGANRFGVQAYRRAANVLRRLSRSVADVFKREGVELGRFVPRLEFTAPALKQDRDFQYSDQTVRNIRS